jgi:flagellar biosynthetic protein FlhB
MVGYLSDIFQSSMRTAFDFASKTDINNEELFLYAQSAFFDFIRASLPFVGIIAVVALAVGFAQVGPVFSGEPMKLKMDRLNIIQNIQNMFKMTTFVELLKNIAKVTLIFILAWTVLKDNMREVVMTVMGTLPQSTAVAGHVITSFLVKVFICFVVIAFVDLAVQRWQYKKQLRMTKEEVKREYKEDEGDPLIKSMRKHLYQEMVMSDMRQAVKTSDVVVTNPTEVAVAMKYDDKAMVSPQVMAKGQRLFAEMIRDMAREYNIPIMQNVPLAWALLELEIGDEIPEDLYAAMAEVLIVVYRMKDTTS